MNSLLADTLKPCVFYFVVIMGQNKKEYIKIVVFVQLQRIYLILPLITGLSGRIEINALQVLLHTFMHTWAPSYNRTLPSIYQIVNGLIDFYVDTHIYIYIHTHVLDMHTCMFVQCTQSTSALCYFLLAPSFLAGSVFSAKVVGIECFQTR